MSYILDALKKSEQQRGNGKIPDVQTVHSSSLNYRDEKKAYWPYFLIVAILLNLIAIVYFIFDKESKLETIASKVESTVTTVEEKDTQANASTPNIVTNQKTDNPEDVSKKLSDKKVQAPSATVQTNPVNTKTKEKEISAPIKVAENNSSENIIEYYDLPESLSRQIPTITISGHIYSSNPIQRSIVINNNFLEEGDYVLDNLILQEITTDGAIFEYDGTRFHYGVVSGWQ